MGNYKTNREVIEEFFPIEYSWYINGEFVNTETSYKRVEDIDGKYIAEEYLHDFEAFENRLDRLDRAAINKAKDWLEEADYNHPGWPEKFTLVRTCGIKGDKILLEDSNATEYTSFEVARNKKKETFAEKIHKMDEAEEAKDEFYGTGDVPFDRKFNIDIIFYEGNSKINSLSVHATSLRDLAEKTSNNENFPLSYKDHIKTAYYGKGWYSYGEDLKYYAEALMDRLTGTWKTSYKDEEINQGLIKSIAEDTPEEFDSKWLSCVVIVQEHVASFQTFDLTNIINKNASVIFDINEPEPTLESIGINYPPYYQEDEISLIGPSKASWETLGDEVFPFEINILEDDEFDFDGDYLIETPAELREFIEDLPEGIYKEMPNLNGTKKEATNAIIEWFNHTIEDMKELILPEVAASYFDEDAPSYRWLTVLLNDEDGEVLSVETIDMLNYFRKANISEEILQELKTIEEPYIPSNIH